MPLMQPPSKEEVLAARKHAGMTQTEAAKLIHATLSGWKKWESGDRKMHPAFWELFLIKSKGKSAQKKADSRGQ